MYAEVCTKRRSAKSLLAKKLHEGVALINLQPHECHWPIDGTTGAHFKFCGLPCKKNGIYCIDHARIAYLKPVRAT